MKGRNQLQCEGRCLGRCTEAPRPIGRARRSSVLLKAAVLKQLVCGASQLNVSGLSRGAVWNGGTLPDPETLTGHLTDVSADLITSSPPFRGTDIRVYK